jgi:hypothetical protein
MPFNFSGIEDCLTRTFAFIIETLSQRFSFRAQISRKITDDDRVAAINGKEARSARNRLTSLRSSTPRI